MMNEAMISGAGDAQKLELIGEFQAGGSLEAFGSWGNVTLIGDGDEGVRAVWLGSREVIDFWSGLLYFWPEWMTAVMGVVLVVLVVRWWKRRKSGEAEMGEAYCRKCGYVLRGLTGKVCPECGVDEVGEGERNYHMKQWKTSGLRSKLAGVMVVLCFVGVIGIVSGEVVCLKWAGWQSGRYGSWSKLRFDPYKKTGLSGVAVWESRWAFDRVRGVVRWLREGGRQDGWKGYIYQTLSSAVIGQQHVVYEVNMKTGEEYCRYYSEKVGMHAGRWRDEELNGFSVLRDREETGEIFEVWLLDDATRKYVGGLVRQRFANFVVKNNPICAEGMFLDVGVDGEVFVDDGKGKGLRKIVFRGNGYRTLAGIQDFSVCHVRIGERMYLWGEGNQMVMGPNLYVMGCLDLKAKKLWVQICEAKDLSKDGVMRFEGREELAGFDVKRKVWVVCDGVVKLCSKENDGFDDYAKYLSGLDGRLLMRLRSEARQKRMIKDVSNLEERNKGGVYVYAPVDERKKMMLLDKRGYGSPKFAEGRMYVFDCKERGAAVYVYDVSELYEEEEEEEEEKRE